MTSSLAVLANSTRPQSNILQKANTIWNKIRNRLSPPPPRLEDIKADLRTASGKTNLQAEGPGPLELDQKIALYKKKGFTNLIEYLRHGKWYLEFVANPENHGCSPHAVLFSLFTQMAKTKATKNDFENLLRNLEPEQVDQILNHRNYRHENLLHVLIQHENMEGIQALADYKKKNGTNIKPTLKELFEEKEPFKNRFKRLLKNIKDWSKKHPVLATLCAVGILGSIAATVVTGGIYIPVVAGLTTSLAGLGASLSLGALIGVSVSFGALLGLWSGSAIVVASELLPKRSPEELAKKKDKDMWQQIQQILASEEPQNKASENPQPEDIDKTTSGDTKTPSNVQVITIAPFNQNTTS